MDKKLRLDLKKPFGKVYTLKDAVAYLKKQKRFLVVVGDKSIYNLVKSEIYPDIIVYDNMCKRKKTDSKTRNLIELFAKQKPKVRIENPPSQITPQLLRALKITIKNKTGAIEIKGEDDLASLAAFIYTPIGSIVAYGQPNKGMVLVEITSDKKNEAKLLLRRFETTRNAKLL